MLVHIRPNLFLVMDGGDIVTTVEHRNEDRNGHTNQRMLVEFLAVQNALLKSMPHHFVMIQAESSKSGSVRNDCCAKSWLWGPKALCIKGQFYS